MAIINPTPADFKNVQKRALDYQQYRSTADVLRAAAEFYNVTVFKSADNKPLNYVTSGLETSVNITDNKIQITINKGSVVADNQPITFTDDFVFEYDKPGADTAYHIYLHYKYVEEYPPNYAYIEIYTNQINDEGYFLLAKIDYQADANTYTIDDSFYSEMRAKDVILREEYVTSNKTLTARANEIESALVSLKETVHSSEIVNIIKKHDGAGSELDADLLDGKQATDFALLNGNSRQRFKVADAVEDDNAVNRRQLLKVKEESETSDRTLTARANEIENTLVGLKETVYSGKIVNIIKNYDGAGSGLDADLLDGKQATDFANKYLSNVADTDILDKIKNVDGASSGLDADTVDGVQGALLGVGGEGYKWVDKTNKRALDTVYTNTTGAPIQLAVSVYGAADNRLGVKIYINDVYSGRILGENATSGNSEAQTLSLIIPSGCTYKISNTESTSILKWFELTK